MKKYRLKEQYKKFFHKSLHDSELTDYEWNERHLITLEALEEVPQRIKLGFYDGGETIYMESHLCFTNHDKDLMEKALNGELLDIESLDDEDFSKWYIPNDVIVSLDVDFKIKGIKAVLKAYLKQKK